ncbi:MAG: nitroreductase/quinone reductase family protein [Chloroflexi bacterium]|nr:nitroreductase/quinone reductase family protein [Chloroflexota bacterium]
MDDAVRQALEVDRNVDITTIGRKSGEARRIEIWHHLVDGAVYLTSLPGKRSWFANMLANPDMTFHVKESAQRDIPSKAVPITDSDEKRDILTRMKAAEARMAHMDVDRWVAESPLIRVDFQE